jgi:hypothetical protein
MMSRNARFAYFGCGAAMVASLSTAVGCGGEEKPPISPAAPAAPSVLATPADSAGAAAPAAPGSVAAPAASAKPEPPPAPKGTFAAAAKSASSGKVDKVGSGDGAFKPDGLKDLVLEAEYEGAALAFLLVATDAQGTPNGEFTADTFVGAQSLPSETGANLNQGKFTAGLAVYEGDKLLNGKDGAIAALSEGKHKLVFHVSSKDASPSGSYKIIAFLPDRSTVSSPVVPMGDPKKSDSKPEAKAAAKPAGSAAPKK